LRWTRLTRWRSALAHLFDLPKVRDARSSFGRLSIAATDRDAARLFAGWLRSRLRWPADFPIDITADDGAAGDAASPLTRVALEGTALSITLQVRHGRGCLAAAVDGLDASTRIVPLGDGSLASLIGEELGVRTRDLAFEQALAAALEIHP
jgi:glucose-6-phosphate dehydrogenase assembly protein OpcA